MSAASAPVKADVLIAGGGPAGSVAAWDLARRGIKAVVLERTAFPRDKVCGDFVEPRGLRIMHAMGCLQALERSRPRPVSDMCTLVEWERRYAGPIAFYGQHDDLSPHGYVISRKELDAALLEAAARAGAIVHEQTAVTKVSRGAPEIEVTAKSGRKTRRYRAPLIVGADGVNSLVARTQGLAVNDPSRTVVAQRAYAVTEEEIPETVGFFDESLFPGYGWVFPMRGGTVNVGIGLLSEVRQRLDVHLPGLFRRFIDGLRRHDPRYATLQLTSRPIGGAVRTYGAGGPNHFDGGVLVGDAGSFVDPMTGEGITPAMESALLATRTLARALEAGRFDAAELASYERDFRDYFGPAWTFLDFCASMLRNEHLARPWLKAFARGCELAELEPEFARVGGSFFGGLEIRPFAILGQVWSRTARDFLPVWPARSRDSRGGEPVLKRASAADLMAWQLAMSRSALNDPLWHSRWWIDTQRRWARVLANGLRGREDPRAAGLLATADLD
jgi:geranylgeranyl reductase family protein